MPSHIGGENLKSYSPITQIIIVAIYTPIVEELTFRIGLIFSKWNFVLASTGFGLWTLRVTLQLEWIYCLIPCLVLGSIIYLVLNENNIERLSNFWCNQKRKIFYILLLAFGFSHLGNYKITSELLIFSSIIVLPHIFAGFIYSYARLNSGIILAICIHSLNNVLPKIMVIISL